MSYHRLEDDDEEEEENICLKQVFVGCFSAISSASSIILGLM